VHRQDRSEVNKNRQITVEQKHIDLGLPDSSAMCMIAEAVKDQVPGCTKVHVDMQTVRWTGKDGIRRTYLTPAVAQSALVRFDAGDDVKPFTFRLSRLIHTTKAKNQNKAKAEHSPSGVSNRARVAGRAVPMLGNATRRRFGIRNLRINQQGQVVQLGTIEPTPLESGT
jgi:hypothetical protein